MRMTLTVEQNGPVTTIIRSRVAARNAMDPASAEALTAALLAFDADPAQSVAVLWGAGGRMSVDRARRTPRAGGREPRGSRSAGARNRTLSARLHARGPPLGVATGRPLRNGWAPLRMGLFGRDGGARGRGRRRTLCFRQGAGWRIRRYLTPVPDAAQRITARRVRDRTDGRA